MHTFEWLGWLPPDLLYFFLFLFPWPWGLEEKNCLGKPNSVAEINLVYEPVLSLGIFKIAIPGYLVSGAAWFDVV